MKNISLGSLCLALIALLFGGCESTALKNRITEKSTVFNALAPDQKIYIQDGVVFPGDSTEMTYMALGEPSSVQTKQKDDVVVEMWTYKKYYPSGEFAAFMTDYSLTRNPNLHRELNVEVGKANVGNNAPSGPGEEATSPFDTATGEGNDLSLPDLPIYNLYVFFYKQKVVDVKIESLDGTKFAWLSEAKEMEARRRM